VVKVKFTAALKRFFPDLQEMDVEARNVAELMVQIEKAYPGIQSYILDDQGSLRKHVNIFVASELIKDKIKLSDTIESGSEVHIIQALSGG